MAVPLVRIRSLNDQPVRPKRNYVLYWMTAFRRARSNFSLERAIEHARRLDRPLLVFEALRLRYPFACDRFHAFILQGMAENARRFSKTPAHYFPFVELKADEGKGLLEALAKHACVVVSDDWPGFFIPSMQAAAASRLDVHCEVVDSNGLYPMWHTPRVFSTAHSFRIHLQKVLAPHLQQMPLENPFENVSLQKLAKLPKRVTARWNPASSELLEGKASTLERLAIDHSVLPVPVKGGSKAGEARLQLFVSQKLSHYADERNEPEIDGTSALSPYLHFGHISSHQLFESIAKHERWKVNSLGKSIGGAKAGWWKLSPSAEMFVDQFVTWRELAFNMASHLPDDFQLLDSLPRWARDTISAHAADRRPFLYSVTQLEEARTHDPLWNAAMGQLKSDGWFHNALRMLWGKKIYEWSQSAQHALEAMEYLMGKYALDGRDPVSTSGYFWVLGRYDRAWGPKRPVFGKLRFMSSTNAAKKMAVKKYIAKYQARHGDLVAPLSKEELPNE